MELKAKEEGRKKRKGFRGQEGREGGGGVGAEWDKLVKETMVALWFMFKLFFIKSNLRFNLSSFFFVFFI